MGVVVAAAAAAAAVDVPEENLQSNIILLAAHDTIYCTY